MATRQSSRAGRGNKMQSLLDTEHLMQPAPDDFWIEGEGAALWKDAERDLDDNEFDSKKNEEEDSVDEDFDLPEDPTLDTEVLGDEKEEKKKKKNVYVDPKKNRGKRKPEPTAPLTNKRTRSQSQSTPTDVKPPPEKRQRRESEPQKRPDRALRQKTLEYTKEREEVRRMEKEIAEFNRPPKKKLPKPEITQKDRLIEAKETEIKNTKSLEEMKRLELIKKKPVPTRAKIQGPKEVTFYSKTGKIFIMFEETVPEILGGTPPKKETKITIHTPNTPGKTPNTPGKTPNTPGKTLTPGKVSPTGKVSPGRNQTSPSQLNEPRIVFNAYFQNRKAFVPGNWKKKKVTAFASPHMKRDRVWNTPEEDDRNVKPKVEVFTVDAESSLLAPKKPLAINIGKTITFGTPAPSTTPQPAVAQQPAPTLPTPPQDPAQAQAQYPVQYPGYPGYYYPPGGQPYVDPYAGYYQQPAVAPYGQYPTLSYEATIALAPTEKKKSIHRGPSRRAGGQEWDDPTLCEWAQDDFRIFVGNLGHEVSDDGLKRAFIHYKSISKAKVIRDKKSGKSKGYGFVSFLDGGDYIKALKEMNGKYICNRPCKITKSRWKDRNIDPEEITYKKK